MNQERFTAVDKYVCDLFAPSDDALEFALQNSAKGGLPGIQVSPAQGKMLMLLAQIQAARSVLEIGTLGGYSTIWLARGVGEEGRVISLEADARHADVAEENIRYAKLDRRVKIIRGKALETLGSATVQEPAPYDLIFIDADKASLAEYFQWSLKLSRPGTVMVID